MKWIGIWILSSLVWLIIGACVAKYREDRGLAHADAIQEGLRTWKAGTFLQAIVMLGLWCLLA